MENEVAFRALAHLVDQFPRFNVSPLSNEDMRWLGRASALIEQVCTSAEFSEFQIQLPLIGKGAFQETARERIGTILFRALGRAELKVPAAIQGSFIPVGYEFDAFSALSKILSVALTDVMIVDAYMDSRTLTDFCPLITDGVQTRLLSDSASVKPTLAPAASRWVAQYGSAKPLNARLALPRSLHDRLILVDKTDVWVLTQSLKDFAGRSPGSISRVDSELAAAKIAFYEAEWQSGSIVV